MTDEQNDRQVKLEALFRQHYGQLRDLASENPRLLIQDMENIVEALGARLAEYDGDPEDESFLAWAGSVIRPAVNRLSKFYQLIEKHRGAIRAGIRSVLPPRNYFDDNNALVEEISQEVYLLVIQHLDSLTEPSEAKLSVRLYGLARRHCLYYVKKARRRLKAVQRQLSRGGGFNLPEVLSDLELASMRAVEHQEIPS